MKDKIQKFMGSVVDYAYKQKRSVTINEAKLVTTAAWLYLLWFLTEQNNEE